MCTCANSPCVVEYVGLLKTPSKMSVTPIRGFRLPVLHLFLIFSTQVHSGQTLPARGPSRLCDKVCIYSKIYQEANCKKKNLEYIPKAGTCTNATTLDVSLNNIQAISPTDFAGYTKVKVLLLGNNGISVIPENMCGNATQVIQLQLNDNNLVTIPRNAFSNLDKLTGLFLDNNAIDDMQPGAFNGLFRLGELQLLYNNISSVPSGIFSSLRSLTKLNLSKNKISELTSQMFTGLKQLLRLDLSDNKITTIDAYTFTSLPKLFFVSLAGNYLVSFTSSLFNRLPLKQLDMSNNNISSFENLDMFLNQKTALTDFKLSGVPLECNCILEPLRAWYRLHDPTADAICKSPPDFDGLHLPDFNETLCTQQEQEIRTTPAATHYVMAMGVGDDDVTSNWPIGGSVGLGIVVFVILSIIMIIVIFVCRRRARRKSHNGLPTESRPHTTEFENPVRRESQRSLDSSSSLIHNETPDPPTRSTSMLQGKADRHQHDYKSLVPDTDTPTIYEEDEEDSPPHSPYIPNVEFDGDYNVKSLCGPSKTDNEQSHPRPPPWLGQVHGDSAHQQSNDTNDTYIKHTYFENPVTCRSIQHNAPNEDDVYIPH
ncbi:uncharacterized protein [Amphiura filiformis]|uniref:uncharacterized protein n=1 Tax=Amphiura filiformis TaxID=82378 RepID=UPI003B21647C